MRSDEREKGVAHESASGVDVIALRGFAQQRHHVGAEARIGEALVEGAQAFDTDVHVDRDRLVITWRGPTPS